MRPIVFQRFECDPSELILRKVQPNFKERTKLQRRVLTQHVICREKAEFAAIALGDKAPCTQCAQDINLATGVVAEKNASLWICPAFGLIGGASTEYEAQLDVTHVFSI